MCCLGKEPPISTFHLGRWGQLFMLAGLLALLCLAALPLAPLQARAASAPGSLSHQIDWQHPFHVNRASSGIDSAQTGDLVSANQAVPNANFPSGCYNGVAYNVVINNQITWTATDGQIEAWVRYAWCPRWQGDSVGLNWASGRAYVLSGCANIYVGDLNPPLHNPIGPQMSDQSGNRWDDDEYYTSYRVCAPHYSWDYTTTALGNGYYKVFEFAQSDGNALAIAESPCYC